MKRHYLKERLQGLAIIVPIVVISLVCQVLILVYGLPISKTPTICSILVIAEGIVLVVSILLAILVYSDKMAYFLYDSWCKIFYQPTTIKEDIVELIKDKLNS